MAMAIDSKDLHPLGCRSRPMKQPFCFLLILLSTLLAGSADGHFTAKGHVHTHSETKQSYSNPDCGITGSCDLKRFTLTTVVYEVWFSDDPIRPTYGTGVIMEYETDSITALEKYAIVQFKKGCVFHTSKNGSGKIDRNISDVVPSFGEHIPFCFREWVIDSQDTDPAYNSDPQYGRFYLLRWNKPGSYDNRTQKFYGAQKPRRPVLYMTDYPAGAFVTGTGVKNVALEFKTCIYKAGDVPVATRRDDVHFAKPINCFEWQNVYVYDFDKAVFQTDLAAVPRWDEPAKPVHAHRLVIIFAALIAFVYFAFLIMRKCRGRLNHSN
ncbi:MAG: hypothetical protein ACREOR_04595 [Candidatus Binatia bacterium]